MRKRKKKKKKLISDCNHRNTSPCARHSVFMWKGKRQGEKRVRVCVPVSEDGVFTISRSIWPPLWPPLCDFALLHLSAVSYTWMSSMILLSSSTWIPQMQSCPLSYASGQLGDSTTPAESVISPLHTAAKHKTTQVEAEAQIYALHQILRPNTPLPPTTSCLGVVCCKGKPCCWTLKVANSQELQTQNQISLTHGVDRGPIGFSTDSRIVLFTVR